MANSWRISRWGLAYALGMLACQSLIVPERGIADDAPNSRSRASVGSMRPEGTSIAALVAELNRQAEADNPASVRSNLVGETVADLIIQLKRASPSDVE